MSANVRISNLPNTTAAAIVDTDILPVVTGIAAGVGVTSKITVSELRLKLGTTAPGGGRTVTSAATYLSNNAVFNVKDFGAVGDGNINDTAAINAATSAANANGGGIVYFPEGTYKVLTLITLYSNVTVRGASHASKIQANAPANPVFYGNAVSHTRVENMTIAGLASFGVLFNASSFVQVLNCDISGMTDNTHATGYATGIAMWLTDDALIRDNYLHGNGYLTTSAASADIQINGNGANTGNIRIIVSNNRALSTTVNANILLYDVQQSKVLQNTVTGARTFSAGAGGYGILLYRTVNNSGLMQDNLVAENLVYSTEGTGIYLQTSIRSVVNANVIINAATVQDDTSLLVGAIANNGTDGVISNNQIISAHRSGIVIGNGTATATFSITGNSIDTVTTNPVGSSAPVGIYMRGKISNSVISGNAITNVGLGIGTPVVDQQMFNNLYSNNSIRTTTDGGIVLYGSSRSSFEGNIIEATGKDGIALVAVSAHNTFTGNTIFDGGTALNNTYSGISVAGCTHNVIVGNKIGNTGATGFKNCIFVASNSNNSLVTGNHCFGAVTANYNVDATAAANHGFYGNYDASAADGRRMIIRQQAALTGSAASVTQLDLGDSSSAGAVGTRISGGDTYVAMNARHLVDGTDTWHQNNSGAASKLLILRANGDMEWYSTAAGTADGNFATFWGTKKNAFTATGQLITSNATFLQSIVALTNNAAAATATLTNAPVAGNPTKWIPINDNGTVRNIPAW